MVAIPVSTDQPGVAARIAYTKTGSYVPLQELAAPRISTLIDEDPTVPLLRKVHT
jgi:zeaxanthin glucosyltransferase